MSRRMSLHGVGIPDLDIRTSEVELSTSSYYKRIDSREDHDEWIVGPAKDWTKTVDLTKYTKVHFQVTHGNGERSIFVGSVSQANPSTGERVLDISGIANRSSLVVKCHVDKAEASRPAYYPATNTVGNSITVSRIWATAK